VSYLKKLGASAFAVTTAAGLALAGAPVASAATTIVTVFNNVQYYGDQGFRNYTNVNGTAGCNAAVEPHEASAGDLYQRYYQNNNVLMDQSIDSIYIKPGSRCRVMVFDGIGFTGSSKLVTDDADHGCADMRYCFGQDWSDRIRSFWIS